jgi:hypothetical protein
MMKNEKKLKLQGEVSSRTDAANLLKAPGDAVVITRGVPRLLLLVCPCGCGEQLPINLDQRAGPAWRIYRARNGAVTLYPSVWRESGCDSHFIIWRDQILLFGTNEDEFDDSQQADENSPTREAVLEHLPADGLISFFNVAEALDAIPWDVLKICRRLVRAGAAWEGRGKERGSFGRKL